MTGSGALSPRMRKAILIALVVGPILTLINQWEGIFADAPFSVVKCALTFVVPFCVSLVSSRPAKQ